MSDTGRLAGKVLFIAGGGGIGDALARRYAFAGAAVVLGDLDGEQAEATAAAITKDGGTALGVALNGAEEGSVAAAVEQTVTRFGGVDGAHVNFASFADGRIEGDAVSMPLSTFDEMVQVNMRGFLLVTRAVVPHLVTRGGGSIVYTSSAEAIHASPERPFYGMTKAAIHALVRHVAVTYGPQDIRANAIAPGLIMHPRLAAQAPPELEEMAKGVAAIKSRLGNPTDIAALGELLLSDDGSYITGQIIAVDGGTTMRP